MKNTVLVGLQWGDEGKGKIVDLLSENTDAIVRFQGGHNAGHTIFVGNSKFVFHIIPSGILRSDKVCLIGNGVVFNPKSFLDEVDNLSKNGVSVENRLFVSSLCHVILPYHSLIDSALEERRNSRIGTTGKGIGPCYLDKCARIGLRVGDLFDKEHLSKRLRCLVEDKNATLRLLGEDPIVFETLFEDCWHWGQKIHPFVADVSLILNRLIKNKKTVFFEGAQGTFLDIDFGTYPYVTSSSPTAGAACAGAGVGPLCVSEVLGVTKAYTTRVGSGPFPTEFDQKTSDLVRVHGGEFGATTGRPRRCGWLDLPMLKYAMRINGLTSLVMTKLDVLGTFDEIEVCVGYRYKGKELKDFPLESFVFDSVEPIYESLDGWNSSIRGVRERHSLPENAKKYLKFVEDALDFPISILSTGPEREEFIRFD